MLDKRFDNINPPLSLIDFVDKFSTIPMWNASQVHPPIFKVA
jgi:hypothetical protein